MLFRSHRRLTTVEPEDHVFVFRRWADLQFLIVMLRRLRRAAMLVARLDSSAHRINVAVEEFDRALQDLAKMRNVGEHIDDYTLDAPKRRHANVEHRQLQAGSWDGRVYKWIGELNIDTALAAAQKLNAAIAPEKTVRD